MYRASMHNAQRPRYVKKTLPRKKWHEGAQTKFFGYTSVKTGVLKDNFRQGLKNMQSAKRNLL